MNGSARPAFVALVVVAGLLAAPGAMAAPSSIVFSIVGYEYAFTSTEGTFAGGATGNAGDRGAWNTDVVHDPLGSTPTYIDGGSFEMATLNPSGAVDTVRGSFVDHGGTITLLDPGANCTNQRYLVQGALADVATTTSSSGSGAFSVTLTHYRTSFLGRCIIYKARIAGTVSFGY
jgi:hypothetical protein